jgi:hypothetical protein
LGARNGNNGEKWRYFRGKFENIKLYLGKVNNAENYGQF